MAVPQAAAAGVFSSFFSSSAKAQESVGPHNPGAVALLQAAVNDNPDPVAGRALTVSEGSAIIPNEGPEGTPDSGDAHKSGRISLYVVRNGDSVSEIADMFGVTVNTILWANELSSAKDIHPGDTLLILPVSGVEHTVKKGETLAKLAATYGGDVEDIASFNGLDSSADLVVGSTLIIPGGELAAPKTASTPAKAGATSGGSLKNVIANPYRGGSGAALPGFYGNPLPGGLITQSIHGWNGVDIGAKSGTPIYAAAAGTVIVSRTGGWNGGYGNYVVIDHGNGTQTLYAHMSTVAASVGSSVAKGKLIGYVGQTGEATGPHLHFEVRGAKNPFASCPTGRACTPQ